MTPPLAVHAMGWGDGCNPGRSSGNFGHDGYLEWDDNAVMLGASAQLLVYSPYVSPGSSDSAWSMLQAGANDYWQVGWIELAGTERHDFVEYSDSANGWWRYYWDNDGASTVNSYVTFSVAFDQNSQLFTAQRSDAGDSVSADATSWAPGEAFFAGETHQPSDQMPGGSSFPEHFYGVQVTSTQNRSWHTAQRFGDVNDWPGTYQKNFDSDSAFGVYDVACSH